MLQRVLAVTGEEVDCAEVRGIPLERSQLASSFGFCGLAERTSKGSDVLQQRCVLRTAVEQGLESSLLRGLTRQRQHLSGTAPFLDLRCLLVE